MPDSQDAPGRETKSRLTFAITLVLALLLGAGGVFYWIVSARSTNAGQNGAATDTFPLETFVVNLSGREHAYLRVGIALGLSRLPARKEDVPVALIRDTIVSILSAARAEQLTQAEGKDKLKAEILQALKDRAPYLRVKDVYFTEFLVQL